MAGFLTRPPNCVRRAARNVAAQPKLINVFAETLERVRARGAVPSSAARHRRVARPSRAAARCQPRRYRDQCRHGAGQGARQEPAASLPTPSRDELKKLDVVADAVVAEPGLHQSHAGPGRLDAGAAPRRCGRQRLWPQRYRRRRAGECRICLGQSDRPDACRPLPRRRVRRRAGKPARFHRLQGDARILHQRCRRPGRCARALGVSALPRGARRRHRRNSGRALSGRLSQAGRRGARRRIWRQAARRSPRRNGCR